MKNINTQLIHNSHQNHSSIIQSLFDQSIRLEMMVAFAKKSGLSALEKPLVNALKGGLSARFAIGLDFFHTEPHVIHKLFDLTKKYDAQLYLSNCAHTFHPKVYAFQHADKSTVIIGSANLTQGGLYNNIESSVLIEDNSMDMFNSIVASFDRLIENSDLLPATKALIDEYKKKYNIYNVTHRAANKHAEKALKGTDVNCKVLSDILSEMKDDKTDKGFEKQVASRLAKIRQAKQIIYDWPKKAAGIDFDFLTEFQSLINLFNSSGLHRGKTRIVQHQEKFLNALADINNIKNLAINEPYAVLNKHFKNIPNAGTNLLTEILHALDNEKYVVMNQNTASGLAMAGINIPNLNKRNVSASIYANYCHSANTVREKLGLKNLTELDALLNYAYHQN